MELRRAQDFTVSALGIGTYLGGMDDATDASYQAAIVTALNGGINFVDTSLNYRNQRSERAVGRALRTWFGEGHSRSEVVVCTKAGYLVAEATPVNLDSAEIAGNVHSMAPQFLEDQLGRSASNLGLETVDVFYIHNPETQLQFVGEEKFYSRLSAAFEFCEKAVAHRRIGYYGVATWEAFRRGLQSVSLRRLDALARDVAGEHHHFRFIQLPFNLAMTEAYAKPVESTRTILELALELGISTVASASILQSRLSRGLPDEAKAAIPGFRTDAQRALQFVRSCPGITVALVGMSKPDHVRENLEVLDSAPLDGPAFPRLFA